MVSSRRLATLGGKGARMRWDRVGVSVSALVTFDVLIAAPAVHGRETVERNRGGGGLVGTVRNDVIDAKAGADMVVAKAGSDIVKAGKGRDSVSGGSNQDELFGDPGDDLLMGR